MCFLSFVYAYSIFAIGTSIHCSMFPEYTYITFEYTIRNGKKQSQLYIRLYTRDENAERLKTNPQKEQLNFLNNQLLQQQ